MGKRTIKEIGDDLLAKGNHYPYMVECPNCGNEYFALFDKAFIDYMGYCYWPCGNNREEAERASENILTMISEVM